MVGRPILATARRTSSAVVFAGMTLVLAVWVLGDAKGGGFSEFGAWVPSLGVAYVSAGDGIDEFVSAREIDWYCEPETNPVHIQADHSQAFVTARWTF